MPDETERVRIQTYIPAYQKDNWSTDADQMDMSLSEFIRTMVQAGRHEFNLTNETSQEPTAVTTTHQLIANGDGRDLQEYIIETIEQNGPQEWDELLVDLTEVIEADLQDAVESLKDDDVIQHSGPDGGYLFEDDNVE